MPASRSAASAAAAAEPASTAAWLKASVHTPTRGGPMSAPSSADSGRANAGAGHHGERQDRRSTNRAVSRTDRVTTPSELMPTGGSPALATTRPRVGLRPTSPHSDDGMRIEPEMSVAWAAGTMRAAPGDAEPPEEPPGERPRSQGLWVGP